MENQLGELIRTAREKRGWTQYDLAEKIGRQVITIRRQESRSPTVYQPVGDESLLRICRVFGWDFVSILQLKHPGLPIKEEREVYGQKLSAEESRLLKVFACLPPDVQDRYVKMMEIECQGIRAEKGRKR